MTNGGARETRARETSVRLFVEADLGPGASVGLSPAQAHYLRHVMRMGAGDRLLLFNGRDGEWLARIDTIERGWGSLALAERTRAQRAEPDLWLVFAPIKRARIDFVAEKATELGVRALWPVFTSRTAISRVNTGRLRANAVEAAEQSRRLTVPEVFEPVSFAELVARWPGARRLVVCDEGGTGTPIARALGAGAGGVSAGPEQEPRHGAAAQWALLVGPEGGFTPSELDALSELPFVTRVGLGPRLLRADTAAVAALACWQALAGDWHAGPPSPEAGDRG